MISFTVSHQRALDRVLEVLPLLVRRSLPVVRSVVPPRGHKTVGSYVSPCTSMASRCGTAISTPMPIANRANTAVDDRLGRSDSGINGSLDESYASTTAQLDCRRRLNGIYRCWRRTASAVTLAPYHDDPGIQRHLWQLATRWLRRSRRLDRLQSYRFSVTLRRRDQHVESGYRRRWARPPPLRHSAQRHLTVTGYSRILIPRQC